MGLFRPSWNPQWVVWRYFDLLCFSGSVACFKYRELSFTSSFVGKAEQYNQREMASLRDAQNEVPVG